MSSSEDNFEDLPALLDPVPIGNFFFGEDGDGFGVPGIHIINGQIDLPAEHYVQLHFASGVPCNCNRPLYANDLDQSSLLPYRYRSTLISQNRLVFNGSPEKSLAFLRSMGNLVRLIRNIDFQFSYEVINAWMEPGSPLPYQWQVLVRFITETLVPSRLVLSLDAGPCYDIYVEQDQYEHQLTHVLETYKAIVEPMRGLGQEGLKEFYVFWACFHGHEKEAEEQVMGEGYQARGKISALERDPFYPHGSAHEVELPMDLTI